MAKGCHERCWQVQKLGNSKAKLVLTVLLVIFRSRVSYYDLLFYFVAWVSLLEPLSAWGWTTVRIREPGIERELTDHSWWVRKVRSMRLNAHPILQNKNKMAHSWTKIRTEVFWFQIRYYFPESELESRFILSKPRRHSPCLTEQRGFLVIIWWASIC